MPWKTKSFGVMEEEREDMRPPQQKKNRELWGQEMFHNMAIQDLS